MTQQTIATTKFIADCNKMNTRINTLRVDMESNGVNLIEYTDTCKENPLPSNHDYLITHCDQAPEVTAANLSFTKLDASAYAEFLKKCFKLLKEIDFKNDQVNLLNEKNQQSIRDKALKSITDQDLEAMRQQEREKLAASEKNGTLDIKKMQSDACALIKLEEHDHIQDKIQQHENHILDKIEQHENELKEIRGMYLKKIELEHAIWKEIEERDAYEKQKRIEAEKNEAMLKYEREVEMNRLREKIKKDEIKSLYEKKRNQYGNSSVVESPVIEIPVVESDDCQSITFDSIAEFEEFEEVEGF